MKKILLITAVVASSVSLLSCSKGEGKIQHSRLIDHIMAKERVLADDDEYYVGPLYKSEQWNWDGKELYRIDYGGHMACSEIFYYNKRNRMIGTAIPAYDVRSEFVYDGKLIDSVLVYSKGELVGCMEFKHHGDDNKLSELKIVEFYDDDNTGMVAHLLPLVVGNDLTECIVAACDDEPGRPMNAKAKQHDVTTCLLTWTGDNVTEMKVITQSETVDYKLKYDDKYNPYCQMYSQMEMDDEFLYFLPASSRNNIVSATYSHSNQTKLDGRIDNTYVYDGSFPTGCKSVRKEKRVLNEDLKEHTMQYIVEKTFVYKD